MNYSNLKRFFQKVLPSREGCWNWIGAKTNDGYGVFWFNGKTIYAHRFIYEILRWKIKKGYVIDHLCRNRSCVNPDHIEPVTTYQNNNRGLLNQNARKKYCKRGHEFTPENTKTVKTRKGTLGRNCRKCESLRNRNLI